MLKQSQERHIIIEKITTRIRLWSSRNLSYAARTQLINSVLISLHRYWTHVFILPKSVLKEETHICRAFFGVGINTLINQEV